MGRILFIGLIIIFNRFENQNRLSILNDSHIPLNVDLETLNFFARWVGRPLVGHPQGGTDKLCRNCGSWVVSYP